MSEYHQKDIFNSDECGLLFRLLLDETHSFKDESCYGGKSKDTSIVDGFEKMPLLVIGKYEKPRCFKHAKSLPYIYIQKKQRCIYNMYTVHGVPNMFGKKNEKTLLLLDQVHHHFLNGIPDMPAIRNLLELENLTSNLFERQVKEMMLDMFFENE
jgi:hypothetical protein